MKKIFYALSLFVSASFALLIHAMDENIRIESEQHFTEPDQDPFAAERKYSIFLDAAKTSENIGTAEFTELNKIGWFSLTKECNLDSILVNHDFRKKGYGSSFLKKIIDHSIERGCKKLELRVHPFETHDNFCQRKKELINFYKKHGFELGKTYSNEETMCSARVYMHRTFSGKNK